MRAPRHPRPGARAARDRPGPSRPALGAAGVGAARASLQRLAADEERARALLATAEREARRTQALFDAGPCRPAARRGQRPPPPGARRPRPRAGPTRRGDARHRRRGGRRRAAAGRHGARDAARALRRPGDAAAARARRHGHRRLDRAAPRRHQPRVRERRDGRDDAAAARRRSARRPSPFPARAPQSRGGLERSRGRPTARPTSSRRGHARAPRAPRGHRPARRRAHRGRRATRTRCASPPA
jgi:hypothetical protein